MTKEEAASLLAAYDKARGVSVLCEQAAQALDVVPLGNGEIWRARDFLRAEALARYRTAEEIRARIITALTFDPPPARG